MTLEQRNQTFEEYRKIIYFIVNRHKSLLESMRMDAEDLRQELAISLMKAIENYDPARGAKPSTYYFKMLRYAVLNLWREQRRPKRFANICAEPLVYSDKDGEEITLEPPFEVDYDTDLLVQEFYNMLSVREWNVLERKINGGEPNDIRDIRFMKIIKQKARRFCAAGGIGV
jgi:RNA polymerase sigma factor (sigma-70 family)